MSSPEESSTPPLEEFDAAAPRMFRSPEEINRKISQHSNEFYAVYDLIREVENTQKKQFNHLGGRLLQQGVRLDQIEGDLGDMATGLERMNVRLRSTDIRVERVEVQISALNQRVDALDRKLDVIDKKIDERFEQIVGLLTKAEGSEG
ncbi:hypothetical protein [Actinomadura rudentiformis]|uniref:Uncharacterized protein n=1 Tax=Actinomadura rudentiformis TaxID=359158 RepID=A0A6H9YEB1_9ACTN|nr:hypothetical protein [Actinomadura rudentiformis]KAB2342715.1 hypothetical protein F8566_37410 [Actinomadura rudentiformis]